MHATSIHSNTCAFCRVVAVCCLSVTPLSARRASRHVATSSNNVSHEFATVRTLENRGGKHVFYGRAAVRATRLASVRTVITPLAVFRGFLSAGALLYRRGRAPRVHAGVNSAWHLQGDIPTFTVRMQGRLGARAWRACVLAGYSLLALRWAGPCARAAAGDLS